MNSNQSSSTRSSRGDRPKLSSHSYREAVSGGSLDLLSKYRKGRETEVEMAAKTESEDTSRPRPVSFFKLFRYSTCLDVVLMIIGTLASFLHGAAFPVAMFIFGDITNAFINREATNTPLSVAPCPIDPPALGTLLVSNFSQFIGTPRSCSNVYTFSSPFTNLTCSNFTLQDVLRLSVGGETNCLTNDLFIDEINRLVYIFIGIAVAAFLCGVFQVWFYGFAAERQVFKIRLQYYGAVLSQELTWFDSNPTGSLSSTLSKGVESIHAAIGDNIGILIQWVSTFLSAIIIGLVREWRLALLLLAVIPFMVLAGYAVAKVGGFFSSLEQKYYASADGVAQEVLTSIRTVQAFGGESREKERYNHFLKDSKKYGVYKGLAVGTSIGSVYFLIFMVYSVSFWFGAYLVSEELSQVGDIITVFFSILIGAFYIGQAGPNLQKIAEAQGAAGIIYDTIDRQPLINFNADSGIIPEEFEPTVELKAVNFNFPSRPDVQVLNNLSLKVSTGQKLALVGSSGSGKSSVVKMIQRLYDVDSGEVLVGGVNVKELNLKWLRSQIGVVSQEPVLFGTTIAENIRYGKEDATMEDIIEAAKNANAHNFISSLPEGYDTHVGERGTQLSGGQKQRIAIARALVRDPKILLLDEATSALDTRSEKVVQEALDTACSGRTTIIIAHRLSTIKDANFICSLDKGTLSEQGTHEELMKKEGIYYDLVTAQTYVNASPKKKRHFRSKSISRASSVRLRSSSVRDERKRGLRGSISRLSRSISVVQRQSSMHKTASKRVAASAPASRASQERSDNSGDHSDVDLEIENSFSTHDYSLAHEEREEEEVVNEEEEKKLPSVSLLRLLRLDIGMMCIRVVGCLAALLNGALFPTFAIIFGEVLNVFARPPNEILDGIHPFAAGFLAIGIASALATFLKFVCFSISGTSLSIVIRSLLFKSLLRQEIGWYDKEENATSALLTKLTVDAGLVQGAVGIRIGSLLESLMALLFSVAIAFGYSWLTALVILGFMPILIFGAILHFAVAIGNTKRSLEALKDSTELAAESIDNISIVSAFGLEDHYYNTFKTLVTAPYRRALWLTGLFGITYAFSQAIVFFGYIITFRFGAFQVTRLTNDIAFTEFENVYRVFAAIIFASIGIGSVSSFAPDAKKAQNAARSVFAIIDRPSLIDGTSDEGVTPDVCNGKIEFYNVQFSYPARPGVKVLNKFGLKATSIEKKTLALVGESGSGKSTIMMLVSRFYDPSAGAVTLDGVNLTDINLRWLRSQIGIVSQEPVLFDASIGDNIRYGALFREVSEEEVISAAKAANIHSFIETLPQGYRTNAGAKGTQLSGGQKQRIAIARALIRDPKILLLDEATSALDTESEKVVQEALDKAREGRTTIVIAHRLSTIQNADLIGVLDKGKVAEIGKHSDLITEVRGLYYKLVYCQNKGWRSDSTVSYLSPPESSKPESTTL